jgi:hypothetical protein
MAPPLQQAAEPIVYGLALLITVISGALVYRQRLTSYQIVRSLVLSIYGLIVILMVLDLLRATVFTLADIPAYSSLTIVLGLAQAVLLLAAAQAIYFSPGVTFGGFPRELTKRRGHLALFVFFLALVVFTVLFAIVIQPAKPTYATDFAGNVVPAGAVAENLIAIVFGLYAFFLAYPTALMLAAARRVAEVRLRQSLYGLGLGWATVSLLYVATETYLWATDVDFTALMYLANAVIFYAIIRNFRRSASLAGFVAKATSPPEQPQIHPGLPAVSSLTESIAGKKMLYEVDPTVAYEATLRKYLEELAWEAHAVFVFTPRSSPLHDSLKGATSVKFFLTTAGVNYMKVAEDTSEVLIPQSDTAIFLDLADKTLKSNKGNVVFVFDSVSELLLMNGIEKTYKFLKQFLELLHEPRSTGVFLFVRGAHEPKETNLLRGIFPNHFVEDAQGPRIVK